MSTRRRGQILFKKLYRIGFPQGKKNDDDFKWKKTVLVWFLLNFNVNICRFQTNKCIKLSIKSTFSLLYKMKICFQVTFYARKREGKKRFRDVLRCVVGVFFHILRLGVTNRALYRWLEAALIRRHFRPAAADENNIMTGCAEGNTARRDEGCIYQPTYVHIHGPFAFLRASDALLEKLLLS